MSIKSTEQAKAVQIRRYESGKRGYAKAVRRFFLRRCAISGDYQEAKNSLPVRW